MSKENPKVTWRFKYTTGEDFEIQFSEDRVAVEFALMEGDHLLEYEKVTSYGKTTPSPD